MKDSSAMTRVTRPATGRPGDGEFAPYAKADIDSVDGEDAVAALEAQRTETLGFLAPLNEHAVTGLTYAPGKWTLKEVVGHLADDERIFTYRALSVARGHATPLPGFDEKGFVAAADFEARPWADLLAEYRSVREATLVLLTRFSPEAWRRSGIVNGYPASARGLAFHIAGHERHHLRIIRSRYLPLAERLG
jgi:DinB superfamily